MNKKLSVLFVDDERYVLDGLRRMLRPMRTEWDMTFVESGAEALERMKQSSYDVLVSDMRMPGMSGAELLNHAMNRHPRTVRLILSGYADETSVMECVNATHQFLAKPCDPEILRATIERLCIIEERSRDERIISITSRLDRLPSIPIIYDELLARMRDPDASIESVASVISKDPAISAKILKLVNSAFFGLRRQVADLTDAVNFLGIDTIRSLALSVHAFTQFEFPQGNVIDYAGMWNHTLQTAAGARALAEAFCPDSAVHAETFTAALLHDMGRLVLAANFPEAFQQVDALIRAEDISLTKAECKLIGFDHAEVGAALFGIWGLPDVIVESVAHHHHPSRTPSDRPGPITFLHVADVWLEDITPEPQLETPMLDLEHLRQVGVRDLNPWHRVFVEAMGKQTKDEATHSYR